MKKVKVMIFIESLMVAISTFSIIPMPNFEWNEKNMKYAICFFPIIGVFCGVLIWVLGILGSILELSNLFVAILAVCIPLLITGGCVRARIEETRYCVSLEGSRVVPQMDGHS